MRSPAAILHGGIGKVQQLNQQQPHFLDSCSLCQRPLAHNSDIFMYRGNTPFCSQECRQEQIEKDDAKERRSSSKRPSSRSRTSADSKKESSKAVRTGAVAVA